MIQYIIRRLLLFIPMLFAISVVTFAIIQLPPGDYLTAYAASLAAESGSGTISQERVDSLRERYGLDQPFYVQYWKWVSNLAQGNMGYSFEWKREASEILGPRMPLTIALAVITLIFTWIIALPLGVYTALRKNTVGDYVASFFGFIGMAIPDFMLALCLMWVAFFYFGQNVGGLFSPEYAEAPWSWGKFVNLMSNIWIPVIVIGTSGIAKLMRILRANLLDELHKPYVEAARSKGLSEWYLTTKYPVRVALNPFVSGIGGVLPELISGAAIVSIVLNLQTADPFLLRALLSQDMYLAGSYLMIISVLALIGVLISDILLAWLDPRIRYT
ncbi:MAG: ABC transporter permease [Chloroflexi bacterium AL-W]|nr:ABC transporter permease [Chloroflexi bacterium AL-N1]NOK67432.1 ABC transporter permease [Chloroflexi bacterium AL-N10]NOK75076.1 ABC transporter permease [Chloroflexi bacterium AL-N5]NOK81863.1 ABC transporter permease [Chloroflexi bacterium AL-W]NOK89709.1 ABC transporter permease [Chloroflexi bacterium AL-N15]